MVCSQKTRPGCGSAAGGAGWAMTERTISNATHESMTERRSVAAADRLSVVGCLSRAQRKPRFPWPSLAHGCPVERNRLFVASSAQPTNPVAGPGPAIHAFLAGDNATSEDVGGRNKSGHGGPTVVQSY